MSELKHWLDETSEADDFERAVLRAGIEADPSQAKQDQIWSGLMATLAVAPLAAATATAQAATAQAAAAQAAAAQAAAAQAAAVGVGKAGAVSLTVAKGFVVGLAIYGATAGVAEVSSRLSERPATSAVAQPPIQPRRAASRVAQPATATASAAPLLVPAIVDPPSIANEARRNNASAKTVAREPHPLAAALPSVATFDDAEPSRARASQLEAETRALRSARDELRAGKLADAFATLEASRRQFSAPELYQEREALMIELLSRSGQATTAEQRARAFLSRFPESPHAQQVRRFIAK